MKDYNFLLKCLICVVLWTTAVVMVTEHYCQKRVVEPERTAQPATEWIGHIYKFDNSSSLWAIGVINIGGKTRIYPILKNKHSIGTWDDYYISYTNPTPEDLQRIVAFHDSLKAGR